MSPIQIGLPDHPDDLRRKVDEEIAELEVRLIARKSYRNTLAPIARLHPEVLQGIFFLAHDSSEPSHKGKTTLLVTWICRDWRELAHQTANIWSHIDFTHREWIEAALSRTKAHELEFTLDCAKAKLAHLFLLCLGNLSRIRSLVITAGQHGPTNPEHGFPRPDFDNLSIWTNPAPSLERLHLEHVFVHGNCFSGVCPSLRSLHLKSCIIGWPALPIVPSITELSIMRPSDRASVGDIMKILQVIGPNLKSLEFWDAANDSQSGLGSSRYQFPELKSFWLRQSNPGAVALFLSQILLPPSLESLHISAHCSDWVTSNLVQAVIDARDRKKWPLDYLTVAYDRPFTIFGITEDWSEPDHDEDRGGDSDSSDGVGDGDVGGDEMSGDEVDDEVDDEDNGGEEEDRNEKTVSRYIELEVLMTSEADSIIPVLNQLRVPIEPIRSVFFTSESSFGEDQTVLEYLGSLGTVEVLTVTEMFLPTLLHFLGQQVERLRAGLDLGEDSFSFRGLEKLVIQGCGGQVHHTVTHDSLLTLQAWLTWKKQCDLPLEDLCFVGVAIQSPSIEVDETLHEALQKLFCDFVIGVGLDRVTTELS